MALAVEIENFPNILEDLVSLTTPSSKRMGRLTVPLTLLYPFMPLIMALHLTCLALLMPSELLCACVLSHVWLFATPWAVARQTPLSMGFSRQGCWSQLPCPPPVDLPHPGIELASLMSPALAGKFLTTSAPGKPFTRYLPRWKETLLEWLCFCICSWKAHLCRDILR